MSPSKVRSSTQPVAENNNFHNPISTWQCLLHTIACTIPNLSELHNGRDRACRGHDEKTCPQTPICLLAVSRFSRISPQTPAVASGTTGRIHILISHITCSKMGKAKKFAVQTHHIRDFFPLRVLLKFLKVETHRAFADRQEANCLL